jgi:hypothetical protein
MNLNNARVAIARSQDAAVVRDSFFSFGRPFHAPFAAPEDDKVRQQKID